MFGFLSVPRLAFGDLLLLPAFYSIDQGSILGIKCEEFLTHFVNLSLRSNKPWLLLDI